MRLLRKTAFPVTTRTGRLSDGSDLVETVTTHYQVAVIDSLGRDQMLEFDHNPTDQEVIAAVPPAPALVPTSKAAIEDYARDQYETWQRWKNTKAEAVTRALPAAVVTALTNRENAAWGDYVATLNAWRTAV